jgi:hypothetical protein
MVQFQRTFDSSIILLRSECSNLGIVGLQIYYYLKLTIPKLVKPGLTRLIAKTGLNSDLFPVAWLACQELNIKLCHE